MNDLKQKNANTNAFPVNLGYPGMTKREYFAALNHAAILGSELTEEPADLESYSARMAVNCADALIVALNRII